jgi:hypothetical protein
MTTETTHEDKAFHIADPRGYLRMVQWPLIGVLFYLLTLIPMPPQYSALLIKLGSCTLAAYLGYWIDRLAMRNRIVDASEHERRIARALIIGACIMGVGLGS